MKLDKSVDSVSAENPAYKAERPFRWVMRYNVEMSDTDRQQGDSV